MHSFVSCSKYLNLIVTLFVVGLIIAPLVGCNQKIDTDQYRAASNSEEEQSGDDASASSSADTPSGNTDAAGSGGVADTGSSTLAGDTVAGDTQSSSNDRPDGSDQSVSPKMVTANSNGEGTDNKEASGDSIPDRAATEEGAKKALYPSSANIEPSNKYPVPADAGTNEILAFLQKMQILNQQLGADMAANNDELVEVNRARVHAAARLARVPRIEFDAVNVRLDALNTLGNLGAPGMDEKLDEFAATLKYSDNEDVKDFGRIHVVRMAFQDAKAGGEDSPEMEALFQILKEQAESRPDTFTIFASIQEVAFELMNAGYQTAGVRVAKIAMDAYADSSDAAAVASAKELREHILLAEIHIEDIEKKFVDDPEKNPDELVAAIEQLAKRSDIGRVSAVSISRLASVFEAYQLSKESRHVYELLGSSFAQHKEPNVAAIAKSLSDAGIVRLDLVGKKLVLEGRTLDGGRLDWNEFADTPVVALFWSSNSVQSMKALRDVEQIISDNPKTRLELIGVNLDSDPRIAQQSFRRMNLSWTYLSTPDINRTGLQTPMARKCGIVSVPFVVLIGKDGVVTTAGLRVKNIGQGLANMLNQEIKTAEGIVKPQTKNPKPDEKKESDKSEDSRKSDEAKQPSDSETDEKKSPSSESGTVDESATEDDSATEADSATEDSAADQSSSSETAE